MGLPERHWQVRVAKARPRHIEEKRQMSQRRPKEQARIVRRVFEPDRLASERLVDAYERLVARSIRVITTPMHQTIPSDRIDQPQRKGA